MNHCIFNTLVRLSKRVIISNNISKLIKPPPPNLSDMPIWGVPQYSMEEQSKSRRWVNREALIQQTLFTNQGFPSQVTRVLNHMGVLTTTVFVGHYLYYFYAYLMRGISAKDIPQAKESY